MIDWLDDLSPDVLLLALIGLGAVAVIAALGRRLSITVGNVHAELTPNGGSSVRDAIDRIEKKADLAVARAEDAATQATFAAAHAANALQRIERIEASKPQAVAIALAPGPDTAG